MAHPANRSKTQRRSKIHLAAIAVTFLLLASACSYFPGYGERTERVYVEPVIVPSPTPDPAIAARWQLDRDLIPVREDWPRDTFHDQHEGCRDRGYGGRFRDGFLFIDVPPEPHTQDVVRKAIAEHLCFAGKPEYAPPGHLRILQAHFTTAELDEIAGQLNVILPDMEIASMGSRNIDNRLNVGLVDLKNEYEARERLEAHGIPQHAVHFEQQGYFIGFPELLSLN